jgi:hypothetical protein
MQNGRRRDRSGSICLLIVVAPGEIVGPFPAAVVDFGFAIFDLRFAI